MKFIIGYLLAGQLVFWPTIYVYTAKIYFSGKYTLDEMINKTNRILESDTKKNKIINVIINTILWPRTILFGIDYLKELFPLD